MLDDHRLDLGWEEQEPARGARGGPPARQQRRRKKKERGRKRRSVTALLISVLLLAALGYGTWWGVGKIQEFLGVEDYNTAGVGEVTFEVKPGESVTRIANNLTDAGVVKSPKAFIKAADAHEKGNNIEPGLYTLRKEMRAADALAMILDPNSKLTNKITIPEGKTAKETYKLLAEKTKIPEKEFEAAGKDPRALGVPDWYFTRDGKDGKKAVVSIEGFLFPDTYTSAPTPRPPTSWK